MDFKYFPQNLSQINWNYEHKEKFNIKKNSECNNPRPDWLFVLYSPLDIHYNFR